AGATTSVNIEEVMSLMQQVKEEAKFEIKKEIVEACTSQAQQLSEVNPAVATALNAMATAINSSVTSIVPIGQNPEVPPGGSPGKEPNQKEAEDVFELTEQETKFNNFVYRVSMDIINDSGYFEKNASFSEEEVNEDLAKTFEIIEAGIEKVGEELGIDFVDDEYAWND